jgi:H/ACA ribonucleoprotein complex subunit 2
MVSDGEQEKKKLRLVSPIASPLAGKKLTKKSLKVVKRAAKTKLLRRGVKEVVKALKKGNKGLCIIAGDISPIDVITHVPILCEEADVPYIYVPSKEDLGAAGATKRPTSCTLVLAGPMTGDVTAEEKEKFKEEFDEVLKEVKLLAASFF